MTYNAQSVVSDGTLAELLITFEVLDRNTVSVLMEGVPVPSTTGLWSWVGTSRSNIKFHPAVRDGVVVTVTRTTNLDELVHQYSQGAQFRAGTLDESFTQILHAAQEFKAGLVRPSDNLPLPVGPFASPGTSEFYARADHVHEGSTGGGGGSGSDGFSTAMVLAYQRSPVLPSTSPGPVTYAFSTAKITVPAGNELAGGWLKTIPAGTDPLWVTLCSAAGRGLVDTATGEEWTTPVVLARDGLNGLNAATVFIYSRTPTEVSPASPSNTCQYNFASGVVTGLNNGWTSAVPPAYGGKFLWVKTATASASGITDTIMSEEWADGQLLAQDGLDGQNGGANGLSNAVLYAYKRVADRPTDNPGPVTYHFPSARITTPSTDALANGWSKIVPAGTGPLWVVAASASNSDITDTIDASEWASPELLGSAGVDGLSVATLYVYRRTSTSDIPAVPVNPVSYDFRSAQISGLTNNWSAAIPSTGGDNLWVTTATASSVSGSDTIASSEWATPGILAKNGTNGNPGNPGANGSRGTVTVVGSASAWSTSAANAAISAAGYGAPINRDVVTLTDGSFTQTRFYDNGSWTPLTAYIDGNLLVTGTLSANKVTGGVLSGITMNVGNGQFRIFDQGGNTFSTYALTFGSRTGTFDSAGLAVTPLLAQVSSISSAAPEAIYANNTSGGNGSHGMRARAKIAGTSTYAAGLVGVAAGYDFYAEGAGTNYGPFTGAHDCLLPNGTTLIPGDILVDVKCVNADHLSNTIFEVAASTVAMQPAIGVFAMTQGSLADSVPSALMGDGGHTDKPTYAWTLNRHKYQRAAMNAVGEGMLAVCGQGGNLKNGDFICTSDMPGKGMKQPDDLMHTYTVAKVRGNVVFSRPDEVQLVPCIYLCG